MSEYLGGKKERQEALKRIVLDLHKGRDVEKAKEQFKQMVRNINPQEISELEQALIEEGISPEEIQELCDVHVEVFKESLEQEKSPEEVPGHPVHTFMLENREIERVIAEWNKQLDDLEKKGDKDNLKEILEKKLSKLKEVQKHYLRKENQLFPYLEKKGVKGPSQVMWGIHDEIRGKLREISNALEEEDYSYLEKKGREVSQQMADMIYKEEKILFPMALEKLDQKEWGKVKEGEEELGFAFITPEDRWSPEKIDEEEKDVSSKMVKLSRGFLYPEQLDLMIKNLPVDITFVDENDEVCFYSAKENRIFPRSPGIIGRKVQDCHPPDSVDIVKKILKEFKAGTKDRADFWIQMGGKFIFIQYFPLFDEDKNYRGVIEVTQEGDQIRELKGEKRLLDW